MDSKNLLKPAKAPTTKSSNLLAARIPFKGEEMPVLVNSSPFGFSRWRHNGEHLILSLSSKCDRAKQTSSEMLLSWLKSQARKDINTQVVKIWETYGLKFNRVAIKDTRSRWGSCSAKNNLNFNWRLILAPEEVLNYVVIHETAHLEQMNHSSAFWELVSQRCSDYQKHRNWLRQNGQQILQWNPRFSSGWSA
jgi:predicted metal-dependent hydrolase